MRLTFFMFFLVFSSSIFWSCEKNIDTTEIITVKDDPTLVSSSIINGQVLDVNGFVIPDAEVFIYHNKLTHQVKSDENGNYSISFPKDSEKVHLSATADNFHNSSFDIAHLDHDVITKDFILAEATDLPYNITNTVVLVDSMYQISGQILFNDGTPQANSLILLFDPVDNFLFSYAQTDENGEYSFAYEPFDSKSLVLINECNSIELIETISLVDEDINVGSFTSSSSPTQIRNISGSVVDCNTDELIEFGIVTVSILGSSVTTEIVDGFFSVDLVDCNNAECYDIQISSSTLLDGEIYEVCNDISSDQSTTYGEYVLCGDPVQYSGEISLEYGSESVLFDVKAIDFGVGFIEILVQGNNSELNETIEFKIPISSSESFISYFNYSKNGDLILGHNEETGMTSTYTLDGDTLEGQFSGPTLDQNNTSIDVTGNFLIIIE